MRRSQLMIPTLREVPADAEVVSHQLMLRAGLIRKVAAGIYAWLPLGLKVLRRVEQIIREEMNHADALELLMPAVQPAELWEESGRWQMYGDELLRITDRHQNSFCFGPTHEEIISMLVRQDFQSYQQLPCNLYQIQTKFRDEIRPRFGVMRSREFVMKDAYSFHVDKTSLHQTYQKMYDAYSEIFKRLGLNFRAVLADTGNIGGAHSHEFHVLAEIGEDLIAYSNHSEYAANVEMAEAVALPFTVTTTTQNKQSTATPNIKTINELASFLKVPTQQCLKTLLVRGKNSKAVALILRGDHELNPIKAQKHPEVLSPLQFLTDEEISELNLVNGFIGPVDLKLPMIVDRSAAEMSDFICGANQNDYHYEHVQWGRDLTLPPVFDLRMIQAGDPSPDGKGTIQLARGIEVGHIFQLGDKYSKAMHVEVLDEFGERITVQMGCYGIGVTRVVAAAIEQNHDEHGIIWPQEMAPFQVCIVSLNNEKHPQVLETAEQLYQRLLSHGFDVLFDDRDERAGVKFADCDLIGIPHRLVVSERSLAKGCIEYKSRTAANAQPVLLEDQIDLLLRLQHLMG